MEDKQEGEENKASCRRSRKDEEGRDFICGCGKKYLSYPALYTHIKTKHEGVQPEGTQKTGNGAPFKRTKPRMQEEVQKGILTMMVKRDLYILNELSNCQGSVPFQQRVRKQHLPKQLYEYYLNHMIKMNSVKVDKSSPVEMVLLLFLVNAGEYLSEPLFQIFAQFVKILTNCFTEHGHQIFDSVFKDKTKNMKPFLLSQCRYLLIVCDFMMRFYIPAEYRDVDVTLMEHVFYDFGRWMRKNKLTNIEIGLKKTYNASKHFSGPIWKTLREHRSSNEDKAKSGDNENNEDVDQSDEQAFENENENENDRDGQQEQQNSLFSDKDHSQEKSYSLKKGKGSKEEPQKQEKHFYREDKAPQAAKQKSDKPENPAN